MTIPPNESDSSSQKSQKAPGHPLTWPQFLKPLDEIPDMNFQSLLRLMNKELLLDYMKPAAGHPSHVRVHRRGHDPADPNVTTYPLSARRDEGTKVEAETIIGMLEAFDMSVQDFREAYNKFYNLKPSQEKTGSE